MNQSLLQTVSEVRDGTQSIFRVSQRNAAGNTDLAARTDAQAGSLQQTAVAMAELAGIVGRNAEQIGEANRRAQSAADVASRGGEIVSSVVGTMTSIKDSSRKVVDIISVIDGIAFQTNILALNAAVEAARAGELGRGFAVVATEVRQLAMRSASAAKEIKTLIGDSVERIDAGSRQVDDAGRTMRDIVDSVEHVVGIMDEIAAASDAQHRGIADLNQSIAGIDAVTRTNATLVAEAAVATADMQEQARKLWDAVSAFRVGDDAETGELQLLANQPGSAPQLEHRRPSLLPGVPA
jgi:methyl-accepting chemotaxis protein